MSRGRLLIGALIVLFGLAWMVDVAGWVEVPWSALLPVVLILIGLAILANLRRRPEPWLVVVGVVLTFLAAAETVVRPVAGVDFFDGRVGEVTETPQSLTDLRQYDLAAGQLTVDLRRLKFPEGSTKVIAEVGAGELVVIVPAEVGVHVEARVGLGEIDVLGETHQGIRPNGEWSFPGEGGRNVDLDLSVGAGKIEVRR